MEEPAYPVVAANLFIDISIRVRVFNLESSVLRLEHVLRRTHIDLQETDDGYAIAVGSKSVRCGWRHGAYASALRLDTSSQSLLIACQNGRDIPMLSSCECHVSFSGS